MFKTVPNNPSFPALETATLERWQAERTFEASVEARAGGPKYVFYDGPPFATGLPHYGHILTSYIKDIVPRYFTMRGYHVPRRWGWDCHGLPVEFEVEKEHGFRTRTDILAFGLDRFNEECRSMVLKYSAEWRTVMTRLGRWVDFDQAYSTMDPDYTESVVWAFKELWNNGLVYEGQKVIAYCTRCQTPLSNFEARQDDAFRPRVDPAVSVRFRLVSDPTQSFLAWTTTPWTLPSNVALAVGSEIEYVRLASADESVWLARSAVERYARELKDFTEAESALGKDLAGRAYQPLFPYFASTPNAFRVLTADFVSTDDGTGIVHLAPAFGEEDAAVCSANGIEGPNPVQDDGTFDATVADFAGQHVFDANKAIVAALRHSGALLRQDQHNHSYPHCWRCDSPLIYRSINTWFVRVTEIKSRMIAVNQRIRWVPEHVRDGRFGNWLENARDWAVSRNRFWGAPVPVWRCESCEKIEVMGSRREIQERSGVEIDDWHRPAIDSVLLKCSCGGEMRRVSDVLDCWFESGAMPYAQNHYPFENKSQFEATFPGDFIVEYIAQTRGWFYTLVVLSAALFNERPFKNAICHGVILAGDGRKMSKRLKNFPDPMVLVHEHGADALRVALMQSLAVRGSDMRFSGDAVRDAVRRFSIPWWNCLHYFSAYAEIDQFVPTGAMPALTRLDRYLLSETDRLRSTLEELMEAYNIAGCYDAIEQYLLMLSTWYVRLSKQRIWQSGMSPDKLTAFEVLYAALSNLARVAAPFLPFLAESVHDALGGQRSIHLEDWPVGAAGWRDHALSAEMNEIRTIVGLVRGVRESRRISHRQPLRSISIANLASETIASNRDLLLEELNVKDVRRLDSLLGCARPVVKLDFPKLGKRLRGDIAKVQAAVKAGDYVLAKDQSELTVAGHQLGPDEFTLHYEPLEENTGVASEGSLVVAVDLTIDAELLAERLVRDINRSVQDLRKEAALPYQERIVVAIVGATPVVAAVQAHRAWLAEQTLALDIRFEALPQPIVRKAIEIGGVEGTTEIMLQRAEA